MNNHRVASLLLLFLPFLLSTQTLQHRAAATTAPADSTYADRLGFPKGARALIIHVVVNHFDELPDFKFLRRTLLDISY